MKKSILVILMGLFTMQLYSKYKGDLYEFYFGRQPSARAEALAKSYSSIGGDVSCTFYNPAGLSLINGLDFNLNYASPYYLIDKGRYTFIGCGYKFNKLLKIGFSDFNLNHGEDVIYTNKYNEFIGKLRPSTTNYNLTLASNLLNNLNIGLNLNLLFNKTSLNSTNKTFYSDFGILYIVPLKKEIETINCIQIGGSIKNFTFSKINYGGFDSISSSQQDLPVISRIGITYKYGTANNESFRNLRLFQLLIISEYQNVLNYDYNTAYKIGCELNLMEILLLRFGYFFETMNNYNNSSNLDKLKEFTYGIGLNMPLNKLIKDNIKVNIKIDYSRLPQPNYTKINYNWDNFNSINFSLTYAL